MTDELTFVDTFIVPNKRERFREKLPNRKHRKKAIQELAHFRHFDPRWQTPISTTFDLELILRRKGAPDHCHAISEDIRIDGKTLPLAEALQSIIGYGMATVLICIPDRLAYYEGEGPSERYLLEKTST